MFDLYIMWNFKKICKYLFFYILIYTSSIYCIIRIFNINNNNFHCIIQFIFVCKNRVPYMNVKNDC